MPIDRSRFSFTRFLLTAFDRGDYSTEDTIAFLLPLFKKVVGLHEAGQVAPFEKEDAFFLNNGVLDIDAEQAHPPLSAIHRVLALFPSGTPHFEVIGTSTPLYLPGYRSFEQEAGHHDPQTDIFCLGLLLGSIAMSLDLFKKEDLSLFIRVRTNPSHHYPRIHPTLGRLITEMTEGDRRRRSPDLYDIIRRLEHYRDYDMEKKTDLSTIAGWMDKPLKERDGFILNKLRNRLFDTSRRNRLLYYKPNGRFVNLTTGSVPLVLDYRNVRPELLFTWNDELAEKIRGMKEIVLNKYLRFEDYPFLPSSLDRVRVESQRDLQEYGFSQLKLVITFLNWHNLKEDPEERIQSPLLLLPAILKKNKKTKEDHYLLKVSDNAAEVNPVLAGQLKELYGIRLPDFIDLEEMSPAQFYQHVRSQIEETGQGILLRYIDKPRIRLIQREAKRTARYYRKRQFVDPTLYRSLEGAAVQSRMDTAIRFFHFLVEGSGRREGLRDPGTPSFTLTGSESNSSEWDFDCCQMVLGNFHYKKMSLVQDYNSVIDRQLQHPVFDALFSDQPRVFPEHSFDPNRPDDWYHVITADPTQTKAILQSRAGYSYIIQGPPGTGKSQTITNLIADFVARGLNILFVCEKRAALDVVYHRLKQVGLEELCCYIHDSQGDKKEFIRNLKTTYEDFTRNKPDLDALKNSRQLLLDKMNIQLETLRVFQEGGRAEVEGTGGDVRSLIERILGLRDELPQLSVAEEELLPSYAAWKSAGPVLARLEAALEETGAEPVFALHPFSKIAEPVFFSDNPYRTLMDYLQQALMSLEEVSTLLHHCPLEPGYLEEPERLKNLVQFAVLLYPLTRNGNQALADPDSPEALEFEARLRDYRDQQAHHEEQLRKNSNWVHKWEEADLTGALGLASRHEDSLLGRLNGSWQRLKKQLSTDYNFSVHSVRPSGRSILESLKTEYTLSAKLKGIRQQLQERYGFDNIETARLSIDLLQQKKGHPELEYLLSHPKGGALVVSLQVIHQPLNRLEIQLQRCLAVVPAAPIPAIRDELETLRLNAEGLRDLLPDLRAFTGLPAGVKTALRQLPYRVVPLEAAIAKKALQDFYQANRSFANIDFEILERAIQQLGVGYLSLQQENAAVIRGYVRQRFLHQLDLSNRSASQLDENQRKFKKIYTEGRKILENEFGKSMRYKSIRELSEKESGLILKEIKPIWLMSPYSVSDSLPIDGSLFDVVIFDEASQITLEEGVPALYRARQAIIVGDEKQMPPSDFFSAGSKDADPDDLDAPEGGEEAEAWFSDETDSLLAQGTRKLTSSLLSWHYRSRYETLISYSNHAFYEGDLLTIPDKAIHHGEKTPIRIVRPEEGAGHADNLFDRSISFHYLTDSVYEKRSNIQEAFYIAHLVRELLQRGTRESIGIIAFSQEQQRAIEKALETLAAEDGVFARNLEESFNRTENDQFIGLIIKNLENIQGDERDIIIMSICYGPDSRRRILMNFGPVNKRGGEKRLNVLFSRARQHMAIVSSIRYEDITNEYNEGASYLRRFLQYAGLVSEGRMSAARTVLDSLLPPKKSGQPPVTATVIRRQIKERLQALGYETAEQVGQSDFKCSLAVRRTAEDPAWALSILIDDETHYHNDNLIELYYQRPAILRHWGWKVVPVYARDWLHQPQKVMESLLKVLKEENPDKSGSPGLSEKMDPLPGTGLREQAPTPFEHLSFRRFILPEPAGEKFWEAAIENNKLIIRWGKTGTRGQIQLKTFVNEESARKEKEQLEKMQEEKGYQPA